MSLDEAMNESRQFDGAFVQDFDAGKGTMLLVMHNPEFYAAAASWSLPISDHLRITKPRRR